MQPERAAPSVEMASVTATFTLDYAFAPAPPAAAPGPLLVALHGWGQSPQRFLRDLLPLAAAGVTLAAPQAPHPFYLDMGSKKVGFHWLTVHEKERAIAELNAYLETVAADALARSGADPQRIVLLGFSQGVSIATRFATAGRIAPAGLIGCCADLPPDVAERLHAIRPFPVLLAYSPEDGIVAPEKTLDAAAQYEAHGFPVERCAFDGGHRITPALVARIGAWIAALPPSGG